MSNYSELYNGAIRECAMLRRSEELSLEEQSKGIDKIYSKLEDNAVKIVLERSNNNLTELELRVMFRKEGFIMAEMILGL